MASHPQPHPTAQRVLAVVGVAPDGSPVEALNPLDLALLRGEAIFEAIRLYQGRPFRLEAHLARLVRSAAALELTLQRGLEALCAQAIDQAGGGDGILRLICTRGVEGELASTAFAIVTQVPPELEGQRRRGLHLVLLTIAADPLVRAASPWLLPGAKSTSYAVNMAASRAAAARGADDAIFVGLGGELLELPTSNLWWRTGETLYTPSLDLGILAGVNRAALLELAPTLGYRTVEGVFSADDLAAADEAFVSSTIREVMPVVTIDHQPVADGHPGAAASKLHTALRRLATS
jgi:4-amino-4-deoxychorismate lyase